MTTVRPPLSLVLVVHLLSSSYVSPSVNRLPYQPVLSHTPPSQFKSDSTLLRQIEVGSRPTDGLDYESTPYVPSDQKVSCTVLYFGHSILNAVHLAHSGK